jgi:hypothetical protein
MDLVLTLLCAYGVMFILRSAQLPGLVHVRNFVIERSELIAKLLACSFCTGFHAGWITYLLRNQDFAFFPMLVLSLASASFCYFLDNLLIKLES